MKNNLYSSGEFAKKCHISKKTLRYYNEHNILKPSFTDEKGNYFYNDSDFSKLQFILFFKYLGFSLNDIKELSLHALDNDFLNSSLNLQLSFIEEKISQLNNIKTNLISSLDSLNKGEILNFESLISLTDNNVLDEQLKNQYLNSSNISSRISLHDKYSVNKKDWFTFIFENLNLKENDRVLELGCGDGSLWLNKNIPENTNITLSDISKGMVKDAQKKLKNKKFDYSVIDINKLDVENEYDLIIANHVLFYIDDLDNALKRVNKALKVGGRFICSTYSKDHMKEISTLVSGFDNRIILSKNHLYDIFGKENGKEILNKYFKEINWIQYEDYLKVNDPNDLIKYILSCHGNQNMYIVNKFSEFKDYVKENTKNSFKISKDAGIFACKK